MKVVLKNSEPGKLRCQSSHTNSNALARLCQVLIAAKLCIMPRRLNASCISVGQDCGESKDLGRILDLENIFWFTRIEQTTSPQVLPWLLRSGAAIAAAIVLSMA